MAALRSTERAAVALAVWLVSIAGCALEPVPGEFLVDPVGMDATLASNCRPGGEVSGPFQLTISSYTGATYVSEPDGNRVWIRNPFGLVSEQCYWISTDAERPGWPEGNRPDCFTNDMVQTGDCAGDHHVPDGGGWIFVHGGFVEVPGLRSRLATHGRRAAAWTAAGHPLLRVIDLVPDDDGCFGDARAWTFHRLAASLELPEEAWGFADGDLAFDGSGERLLSLSPDDKALAIWSPPWPCDGATTLPAPRTVALGCKPDGPLAVDPDGDRAFALCSTAATLVTVSGLSTDEPAVRRRVLGGLARPSSVAYEPVSDTVWIATPKGGGKVRRLSAEGGRATTWTVPGASRLAVGETRRGDERVGRVYAVGDDPAGIYRFDPADDAGEDTAWFQAFDEPVLGLAVGATQQELAIVVEHTEPDGAVSYRVRSLLDRDHLEAQPDGGVRLFAAGFVEYPRDPQLNDLSAVGLEIDAEPPACADLQGETAGWTSDERAMYQLCCLQRARADQVAENLDYLQRALLDGVDGASAPELLIAVNPTALLQSSHCVHAALEYDRPVLAELGLPFLETVGERVGALVARGDAMPVLLVHTAADSEDQVPYSCPEYWGPGIDDADCDVTVADQAAFEAFLDDLFATASLARVAEGYQGTGGCAAGELPLAERCVDLAALALDYEGLAGGFDRAIGLYTDHDGAVRWPSAYAAAFPGAGAPFTYFGGAGNYPYVSHAAAKELAPWDAALRPTPLPVGEDPARWDQAGDAAGIDYLAGVTVSHTRLYELARSGLFVADMFWHAMGPGGPWDDARFVGDESPETMGAADFAALTHYLTYHVLAARDVDAPRVLYFHLPDISAINLDSYPGGRMECTDPADCAGRDALQDWIRDTLPTLGPAVAWGLPEEYR